MNLPKGSDRIPMDWSRELGRAIRRRRKAFSLTQQALADTAGCSKLTILELEAGKPSARLDSVVRVLTTLGIEMNLVNGNDGLVDRT